MSAVLFGAYPPQFDKDALAHILPFGVKTRFTVRDVTPVAFVKLRYACWKDNSIDQSWGSYLRSFPTKGNRKWCQRVDVVDLMRQFGDCYCITCIYVTSESFRTFCQMLQPHALFSPHITPDVPPPSL